MKIFDSEQIRTIDAFTIENEPIASIDLMERASNKIYRWINSRYNKAQSFVIFAGPGNNGGDGLALARMLSSQSHCVRVFILELSKNLSKDCAINKARLVSLDVCDIKILKEKSSLPKIKSDEIIIDAIFGSGLSKPLDGFYANLVKHINGSENQGVISIDIPSGLFGEDNSNNNMNAIVKADFTLSFHFPKLSFFFSENSVFTGEWQVLPIDLHSEIINKTHTNFSLQHLKDISFIGKQRNKFSHKGNFGHVLLIAGSVGKMGAAILASKACLRAGCGLITTHIPEKGYHIMQTACPEAMVSVDYSTEYFSMLPNLLSDYTIAIGPGIAQKEKTCSAFRDLLEKNTSPMVIDADAINILAKHSEILKMIPENSILTPHPGEFERLVGKFSNGYLRLIAQIDFSKRNKLIVVLKGAYTSISFPDGSCIFNSTGNPGMATAGSGDVLTGIIAGLLAQGFAPDQASKGGVFIHGLAGDLAKKDLDEKSLIANDIIDCLGKAFLLTS